jgi:hypothetical protein
VLKLPPELVGPGHPSSAHNSRVSRITLVWSVARIPLTSGIALCRCPSDRLLFRQGRSECAAVAARNPWKPSVPFLP